MIFMGIEELVLPSMELTSDTIALMMLLVNVSTKSQCLIRVVLGQYSLVQMEMF